MFTAYGSVVWFPIAIVIAVRQFRAGYLPATREFVQLFILGIVALGIVAALILRVSTDGLH
jgi:hypothetical protein